MFGEIIDVNIDNEEGCAFVTFENILGAFSAQISLNDYYLEGYNASLKVKWVPQAQKTSSIKQSPKK